MQHFLVLALILTAVTAFDQGFYFRCGDETAPQSVDGRKRGTAATDWTVDAVTHTPSRELGAGGSFAEASADDLTAKVTWHDPDMTVTSLMLHYDPTATPATVNATLGLPDGTSHVFPRCRFGRG